MATGELVRARLTVSDLPGAVVPLADSITRRSGSRTRSTHSAGKVAKRLCVLRPVKP